MPHFITFTACNHGYPPRAAACVAVRVDCEQFSMGAAFVAPCGVGVQVLLPYGGIVSTRKVCNGVAKIRRGVTWRMQDSADDGAGAEDEAPSDTFVPSPSSAQKSAEALADEGTQRNALISRLLELCAITGRGQLASVAQVASVDEVVMKLEEMNPNPEPVETELIDGTWTLVYTSAKLFRSNPFLAAAATPLLQIGQARQTIDVGGGKLSTEVDVVAFPVTSGTVKTVTRVTPVGAERLELTVEKTNITGGKLADRLDLGGISFDIPVEQIYSRVRGASPETFLDTYYLDERLRISRSKAGSLYIYTRQQ